METRARSLSVALGAAQQHEREREDESRPRRRGVTEIERGDPRPERNRNTEEADDHATPGKHGQAFRKQGEGQHRHKNRSEEGEQIGFRQRQHRKCVVDQKRIDGEQERPQEREPRMTRPERRRCAGDTGVDGKHRERCKRHHEGHLRHLEALCEKLHQHIRARKHGEGQEAQGGSAQVARHAARGRRDSRVNGH